MVRLAEWRRLFRLPFRLTGAERQVEAELDFHLRMRIAELVALGWSESDARTDVLRRFGDVSATRHELVQATRLRARRANRAAWLGDLSRDVRFAARSAVRESGFTLVVVAVLALGVGITTAVVSIANRLVLSPLPYPRADRLAVPSLTSSEGEHSMSLVPSKVVREAWSKIPLLESVEAHRVERRMLDLPEAPLTLALVRQVTPGVLPLLGAEIALGRGFFGEDTVATASPVAVLPWMLWHRRFGGDPAVLGRSIRLDGIPVIVVGVLRPRFDLTSIDHESATDIWVPLRSQAGDDKASVIIARRPDVSWKQITAELTVAFERLPPTNPPLTGFRPTIQDAAALVSPRLRRSTLFLAAAAGLVLLVAAANVASLLLGRAVRRNQEFGVRSAIGAGRGRVVRQLATEALLLGLTGAVLGLGVGLLLLELARRLRPSGLRFLDDLTLDPTMVAVAVGVSLLAAIGFGLGPIWAVARADTAAALVGRARRSFDSRGARRLRAALVIGQLAISLTLVAGAGLLARSYLRAQNLPLGLDTNGLAHVWFELPQDHFPEPTRRAALEEEILTAARSVPGVRAAALSSSSPLEFGVMRGEFLPDRSPNPARDGEFMMPYRPVSPEFFTVAGIPFRAGRPMSSDTTGLEIVIDETTARRYWPNGSAVGQFVAFGRGEAKHLVVGVVADQRIVADVFGDAPTIYALAPRGDRGTVVLRLDRPDALGAVGTAISRVHADIRVRQLTTAEEGLAAEFASRRFSMALVLSFASLTLVIAATGLYGAIALSVAQRTFEIGVRLALGATPERVGRQVVWEGARRIGVALVLGGAGAAAVGALIRASLYRSTPWDPPVFVVAATVLVAVSVLATVAPARRASRVDPLLALRSE